jgi:hypothetical protein
VGQTDTYYAVEMADRSLGYLLKTDAKLLNYQVTLQPPITIQSTQVATPPNDAGTGQSGQPLLALAFIITIAGLGLSIAVTMARKKWPALIIAPSIVCIALLLLFKSELDNAYAAEVMKVPVIQINYEAGLWLCLVSYGIAIVLAMCPINSRSTSSTAAQSLIDQVESADL